MNTENTLLGRNTIPSNHCLSSWFETFSHFLHALSYHPPPFGVFSSNLSRVSPPAALVRPVVDEVLVSLALHQPQPF
jgi:hypothetical protein